MEEYPIIRCSKEFKELLEDVINRWQDKHGFSISSSEATNIICQKIKIAGGIRL